MIPTLYDCFKHWAKSGSVYIISDTHFEDAGCKLMDKNGFYHKNMWKQ